MLYPSTVRLHDLLSNGQANPGAFPFGRLEQAEHVGSFWNSGTTVGDCDADLPVGERARADLDGAAR